MDQIELPSLLNFQLLKFAHTTKIHLSNLEPQNIKDTDPLKLQQPLQIKKENRLYYPEQFVRLLLILKLNSLAKIQTSIPKTDKKHLHHLLKTINKSLPLVEIADSDSGFMKQLLSKIDIDSFEDLIAQKNFLQGNCLSTTILYFSTVQSLKLIKLSQIACGLCFEVFDGRPNAFIPIVHKQKNHKGQFIFANRLNKLILFDNKTSHLGQARSLEHTRVQDAYSLRCTPQVNGVAYQLIKECIEFLDDELSQLQLSYVQVQGQWFPTTHSDQRCVQLFDFLAIALHEVSSISYVRSQRILNHLINKLPAQINAKIQCQKHLTEVLECVSSKFIQNKNLCYPTSADTTIRSNYKHDVQNSLSLMYKKYMTMWKNLKAILGCEVLLAISALKQLKQYYKQQMTPKLEDAYAYALKKFQKIESLAVLDIIDLLQVYYKSVDGVSSQELLKQFSDLSTQTINDQTAVQL